MKLKYVYTCHSYCVTEYTGYNESKSTSASVRIEILSIKTWKRAEKTDDVTLKSKAESYRTECDRQRAIEKRSGESGSGSVHHSPLQRPPTVRSLWRGGSGGRRVYDVSSNVCPWRHDTLKAIVL